MPIDSAITMHQWGRYQFVRDNGHADYVKKADKCNNYFIGNQWDENDRALLLASRRPAMTINKIISTISNVLGEQIHNRTDIAFQPRSGAPSEVAETLTKVFRQISDSNQLDWKRSDMFCDGIITGRGFLETRLDFDSSMTGEIKIDTLNPKNVLIDPDAEEYDPDTWNDVFITKWMTWQDIKILYNHEDAEYLKNKSGSFFLYGFDSIERERDRFGYTRAHAYYSGPNDQSEIQRNIRVIERQHKLLDSQPHFVDVKTGIMRPVPQTWSQEHIGRIAQQYGLAITSKLVKRIRWTVTADNCVLHDDWSPFKHFTVIPYFPYFRRGKTVGLVENLLGPQEYLNKVTSQELHVINTTANSGWKVKTGSLRNITIEELELRGAETGLVIELDDVNNIEKILPNQTPSGLERFSYKAEEHIKTISGVNDYQTGNAREDVSAKAVAMNQSRGSLNLAKPLDGIARTDYLLARNVLDMVQEFYVEPRVMTILNNRISGETEQLNVNTPDPSTGVILNDLTLGEFEVIVSSTPHRETMEDTQFEQGVSLRELGVQIPDEVLIENSRLNKRGAIIKQMQDAKTSPEAQYKDQMQKMQAELELANLKAESTKTSADAELKTSKAQMEQVKIQSESQGNPQEQEKMRMEMDFKRQEFDLKKQEIELNLQAKREELQLKKEELQLKLQATQVATQAKVEQTHATTQAKLDQTAMQGEQQAQQHQQALEFNESAHEQKMEQGNQSLEQGESAHKQSLEQGKAQHEAVIKQTKAKAAIKPKPKAKTK